MRCVVEPAGASWKAYCVDIDVAVEGETIDAARAALDGELERLCLEGRIAAPTREVELRYLLARCRSALAAEHSPAPVCYVFRAPPQPMAGLA
jgi:hypothetical protein